MRRALASVSFAAVVAFVLCTSAAIVVFPGGTRDDATPRGYLLSENFLSDLGGTFTGSGKPNGTARPLFIAAMAAVAVALAALALALRAAAARRDRPLGSAAVPLALASGIGFVRAATVPWNRDYEDHMAWVRSAFLLLALFVVLVTVLQVRARADRRVVVLNVAFLVALVAYLLFDVRGPDLSTAAGLRAQVVAQKVIVVLAIADLGALALAARRGTGALPHLRSPA
jgi:4-amino-4-deoxy-L-arabinose transferase-like glycosyltransferase